MFLPVILLSGLKYVELVCSYYSIPPLNYALQGGTGLIVGAFHLL